MATEVTPRKAVWKHLLDDPAVAALVGDRIYYQTRPDGTAYPCVVISTISRIPRRDLDGMAWAETRLQVTVMDTTEPGAEAVAKVIQDSLDGFGSALMAGVLYVMECRVETAFPMLQEETGQTHYHVDVVIIHK